MKCYKITFQKRGELEQKKICTSMCTAIKFWFTIRHYEKWSLGIVQILSLDDLNNTYSVRNFLE